MLGAFLLQIILITLYAVFASAEIAVISLNETKLKQEAKNGDVRAERLMSLTKQPARFLATIQVAITLAGLLGSAFAADNFSAPLVAALTAAGVPVSPKVLKNVALVVITLILSYFSLVFGELVPKRIAMKKSEALALGMSGMLYVVAKIFAPLVALLTVSTNFILKRIGLNPEEETKDEIIGILDVKDFFRRKEKDKYRILEYDADAPYFVPETMRADVLLRNMKQQKQYFAVVIDEYGGVTGIITLHDLIEELVGEIDEEEENSAPDIEQIGENQWKISGSASLEKVAESLQLDIPFREYETYGGFLCSVIGRIPNDGEQFECEIGEKATVKVQTVKNHRITDTLLTIS